MARTLSRRTYTYTNEEHLAFIESVIRKTDFSKSVSTKLRRLVQETRSRMADPYLYMAAIGEWNSGKTTFINALLRSELLSVSIVPTTAAATRINYSAEFALSVRFRGQTKTLVYPNDQSSIWDTVQRLIPAPHNAPDDSRTLVRLLTADPIVAAAVEELRIRYPSQFLEDTRVVIIDTPGTNAANEDHLRITQQVMEREADGGIVLVPAQSQIPLSLVQFLKASVSPFLTRCLFIVTKMDELDPSDQELALASVRETLQTRLGLTDPLVLGAAPRVVMKQLDPGRRLAEDEGLWLESFAALERKIKERLIQERDERIRERVVQLLDQLFEQLEDRLRSRSTAYNQRQSNIERERIPDLRLFAHQQFSVCTDQYNRRLERIGKEIEDKINFYIRRSYERIRSMIFDADDLDELQSELNDIDDVLRDYCRDLAEHLQGRTLAIRDAADAIRREFDLRFKEQYQQLVQAAGYEARQVTFARITPEFVFSAPSVSVFLDLFPDLFDSDDFFETVASMLAGLYNYFFKPLSEYQWEAWQQVEPRLSRHYQDVSEQSASTIRQFAWQMQEALENHIEQSIGQYQLLVDTITQEQQRELAELQQLQESVSSNLVEIRERRKLLS